MTVIEPIGYIYTDFTEKFGLPRQSGINAELKGMIVLQPAYRRLEMVRELDQFSHLWLLWGFSQCTDEQWHATVRPPRLGGNKRVGVLASRSPFRPNHLGLSCVRLDKIDRKDQRKPLLYVSGIDMVSGSPIYDIKPYIPVTDCQPQAWEGYTAATKQHLADVVFPSQLLQKLPADKQAGAVELLRQDPRPGYKHDPAGFGIAYAGFNIRFTACGDELTVVSVEKSEAD